GLVSQESSGARFYEQLPRLALNAFGRAKYVAALGDMHGARLSRPVEHVLKQMVVARPMMGKRKRPTRQSLLAALRGDQRLKGVELGLVAQAEAVSEDTGTRI